MAENSVVDTIVETETRLKVLNEELEKLNKKYQEGSISADAYAESLKAINDEQDKLTGKVTEANEAIEEQKHKVAEVARETEASVKKIGVNISYVGSQVSGALGLVAGVTAKTNPMISEVAIGLQGFVPLIIEVGNAARVAGISIKAAFATNPVGLAIAAITTLLSVVMRVVNAHKQQKEAAQAAYEKERQMQFDLYKWSEQYLSNKDQELVNLKREYKEIERNLSKGTAYDKARIVGMKNRQEEIKKEIAFLRKYGITIEEAKEREKERQEQRRNDLNAYYGLLKESTNAEARYAAVEAEAEAKRKEAQETATRLYKEKLISFEEYEAAYLAAEEAYLRATNIPKTYSKEIAKAFGEATRLTKGSQESLDEWAASLRAASEDGLEYAKAQVAIASKRQALVVEQAKGGFFKLDEVTRAFYDQQYKDELDALNEAERLAVVEAISKGESQKAIEEEYAKKRLVVNEKYAKGLEEINKGIIHNQYQMAADYANIFSGLVSSATDTFGALVAKEEQALQSQDSISEKEARAFNKRKEVYNVFQKASIVASVAAGIMDIWTAYAKEKVANAETAVATGPAAAATLGVLNTKSLISAIAQTVMLAGTGVAQWASIDSGKISATTGSVSTSSSSVSSVAYSPQQTYVVNNQDNSDLVSAINGVQTVLVVDDLNRVQGRQRRVKTQSGF